MTQSGLALKYASVDHRRDERIVLKACLKDPWSIKYAHSDILEDYDFI